MTTLTGEPQGGGARLRQASRLFADRQRVLSTDDLTTIDVADIRASRVFPKS